MSTQSYIRDIVIPGAYLLLPPQMATDEATILLLAIGLQESRFIYRKQVHGPAVSFWQYEKAGITGVLRHPGSKPLIMQVLKTMAYDYSVLTVYEALEHNDVLAAVMSRLLLWTDPKPLPKIDDVWGAWDYYTRNWRPGRPRSTSWEVLHLQAKEILYGRVE